MLNVRVLHVSLLSRKFFRFLPQQLVTLTGLALKRPVIAQFSQIGYHLNVLYHFLSVCNVFYTNFVTYKSSSRTFSTIMLNTWWRWTQFSDFSHNWKSSMLLAFFLNSSFHYYLYDCYEFLWTTGWYISFSLTHWIFSVFVYYFFYNSRIFLTFTVFTWNIIFWLLIIIAWQKKNLLPAINGNGGVTPHETREVHLQTWIKSNYSWIWTLKQQLGKIMLEKKNLLKKTDILMKSYVM